MKVKSSANYAAMSLAVMVLSSCGLLGANGSLEKTAERLGDIRSGKMMLELTAATAGGAKSGFGLRGPFSLPSGASLPAADLAYRPIGPEQDKALSFLSTGESAYIKVEDQAYELPPERVSGLKGKEDPGAGGPFDRLRITDWVIEPKTSNGPQVNGVATEMVEGKLDVATALNNIFDVARELGKQDLPKLEGEEAERLNQAVRSSRLEVISGKRDHILRRLSLQVDLAADGPRELGPEIQKLLGVSFKMTLAIDDPNKPVKVAPPRNPLPLSRLDSLGDRRLPSRT